MQHSKHIIVIDDDAAIQDALRLMLEHKGYTITQFRTGEPVLTGNYETPALFILDKQLPGIDGLDICRHLKGNPNTSHIPVLLLSASPHVGRMCQAAGADAFLEKPYQMKQFREAVEKLVSKDAGC